MQDHKTICIPFKKTGYCKLGDSCKYLHIRDIKEDLEDDNCVVCKSLESLVVAPCGHYYCETCVGVSFKKTTMCSVCQTDTYGQFVYR